MLTYVQTYNTLGESKDAITVLESKGIEYWELGMDSDGKWLVGFFYEDFAKCL